MSTIKEAATDFLSCRRIAVTGVSRQPKDHGGNIVFNRLKERGYDVFPVNPSTDTVEGVTAYPDLQSIPGGVEAVVIATAPEHALDTVRQAANLGMTKVWMHRSMGAGSVSDEATTFGRAHHMVVIDGGCPLMFGPTADGGHKVMCAMLKLTGKVPRRV
jgi:predicted CoA-binding protein